MSWSVAPPALRELLVTTSKILGSAIPNVDSGLPSILTIRLSTHSPRCGAGGRCYSRDPLTELTDTLVTEVPLARSELRKRRS
jgi:hypothetical protein